MIFGKDTGKVKNFIAMDVETANADMASICQIGIARFENGIFAGGWKSYVDPQDDFDEINVGIHGIDEAVVVGAPTFGSIANKVASDMNGHIVVTHTTFDKVAIYEAGTKCKVSLPSCTWLDSACVARRAWKELSRSGYYDAQGKTLGTSTTTGNTTRFYDAGGRPTGSATSPGSLVFPRR
jgi:DNA polymerase III subunit epsilon